MAAHHPLNKRRSVIRVLLLVLLVALGFTMYNIGKEYTIVVDNDAVTIDGREYSAIPYGALVIDGDEKKALEIWEDDRLLHKLTGANHKLVVKVLNEDDESVLSTVEHSIKLDFNTKRWMISLPAIVAGAENVLVENPVYTGEAELIPDDEPEEEGAEMEAEF